MSDEHEPLSRVEGKATINVSIPADQREAFYAALARLKQRDGRLFTSASALIVQAVLDCAARLGELAPSGLPVARKQRRAEAATTRGR
jgi:hypothetical protein